MDVSYIIPCFKSQRTLPRCLTALANQAGVFTREVIIVDSTPGLKESDVPLPLGMRLVISEKRMYPGQARNKGLEQAHGKYIAFIDSDVVLNPDWTSRMLKAHPRLAAQHGPNIIVSGSLQNDSSTRTPWADALTLIEFYQVLPSKHERQVNVLPSANMFTTRASLESLGINFPPHRMAEDVLFCRNAVQKGVSLFVDGANIISHITEKSYLRYTFYLGMATSLVRLGETTTRKRIAFLLILPFGSLYKLLAVVTGLWRTNPKHLLALVKRLPFVLLGLLALHAGMLAYPLARKRMRESASSSPA